MPSKRFWFYSKYKIEISCSSTGIKKIEVVHPLIMGNSDIWCAGKLLTKTRSFRIKLRITIRFLYTLQQLGISVGIFSLVRSCSKFARLVSLRRPSAQKKNILDIILWTVGSGLDVSGEEQLSTFFSLLGLLQVDHPPADIDAGANNPSDRTTNIEGMSYVYWHRIEA